jgi:signal transduction histidine kinase
MYYVRRLIDAVSRVLLGLRFRLLLLVLLACTPLVGLTLYTASQERRRDLAAWRERARQLVQVAHRAENNLVEQTRELLLAVAESAPVHSGSPEACKKSLEEVFTTYPGNINLSVVGTNAEVVASARPLADLGSQADRSLVRQVQKTRSFATGEYLTGLTKGKPTLTFGCPVLDGSGAVQGVVLAWVGLECFTLPGSALATNVPKGASWAVVRPNGNVLLRYPGPWPPTGHPFPNRDLIRRGLSQPDSIVEAPDSQGAPGFYAFAPLDSQLVTGSAMTVLGIPRRILFAAANRALVRNLCWIGVAAGLALALGWVGASVLIVKPVKALVQASTRLATGDLTTRTGLRHGRDELGQLTRTFDHMAQALEQRELERQLAEETLQTRDHMMRELPLLPAAVCVCDQLGNVELYNRAAVELWGCEPPDPQAGRRFCGAHQLFYPDGTAMPPTESPAAEVLRTGLPLRNRELAIGRPDGSRVPVLANVVPLRNAEGSLIGVVSCLQDITDRKRAEARLQESNDKLQLLSRRLVESQEMERRHIARELHDEVGQTLTVAEMNLQAVMQSSRTSALTQRLKESLQAVERVLAQVRDLSLNLRPSMLDDLGLESALRWYVGRQAALSGLRSEFQADTLEGRLDPLIETACFRVAQEALTNIVRHAHARAVTVTLRKQDRQLHLLVRDDGVGFEVDALRQQATRGASLGLLSMEERATLVDGRLELKSTPGQGTEVHAFFPLKWRIPES